jgi:hypothetical protein
MNARESPKRHIDFSDISIDAGMRNSGRLSPRMAFRILRLSELDDEMLDFAREYCDRELDPLLTPVTVDPAHPFRESSTKLCARRCS